MLKTRPPCPVLDILDRASFKTKVFREGKGKKKKKKYKTYYSKNTESHFLLRFYSGVQCIHGFKLTV